MPSGKIHRQHIKSMSVIASAFGLVVVFLLVVLINPYITDQNLVSTSLGGLLVLVGYNVGYFWASRYLDPDADQLSLTASEGRLMREAGCLGFLVVWWMLPYAYIMKYFGGHRGLAHWHVIGTLTRALWVAWVPALIYIWSGLTISFYPLILAFLVGILCGLMVADSLHIWLDHHPSVGNRYK